VFARAGHEAVNIVASTQKGTMADIGGFWSAVGRWLLTRNGQRLCFLEKRDETDEAHCTDQIGLARVREGGGIVCGGFFIDGFVNDWSNSSHKFQKLFWRLKIRILLNLLIYKL
jgi:hypothetical protein